jgi:hypothetical protein
MGRGRLLRKGESFYLARLARVEPTLLSPVQHRAASVQKDLALLRSHDALVSARTQLINHVRGLVKSVGSRLPACSTSVFARKISPHTPESLRPALLPVLEQIASLTDRIKALDRQIPVLAEQSYPQTKLLRQIKGVGSLTSLAFVLTLEAHERFPKSRTVGAFLGLVPGRKQSGNSDPQRRITKRGDSGLRRLLVNAAHYILGPFGPDSDLRRFGSKIASRGGQNAKKRAVVAVARKLAVLLHHLWRSAEVYEPLHHCEAAWAASHTKNTYLAAQYRRLARRIGKKKALVAVGHSILVIVYHVLSRRTPYQELGGNYFEHQNEEAQKNRLIRKLEALGLKVTVEKVA